MTHLQIKEIDVERLKQLAEEQKAHIHVPFHSLKQSDEPQQTLLEKAEHTLEGEAHHLCAACRQLAPHIQAFLHSCFTCEIQSPAVVVQIARDACILY